MSDKCDSTESPAKPGAGAPPDDRIETVDAAGGDAEKPRVFSVVKPSDRRGFLGAFSRGAVVGATAFASSYCDNQTGPDSTSTTTSSTTVTTTTVTPTFTIAGVVSDKSGKPVAGARVFVVDGPNANKSSMTDGNGYYSIPGIVVGSFTLRTTMNGVFLYDIGVTVIKDTRLDFSVTTTTTTSTSTSTVKSTTTTGCTFDCTCDLVHYWYPN